MAERDEIPPDALLGSARLLESQLKERRLYETLAEDRC
jgi:hypothetical protein